VKFSHVSERFMLTFSLFLQYFISLELLNKLSWFITETELLILFGFPPSLYEVSGLMSNDNLEERKNSGYNIAGAKSIFVLSLSLYFSTCTFGIDEFIKICHTLSLP
jgi:hypothetical protein